MTHSSASAPLTDPALFASILTVTTDAIIAIDSEQCIRLFNPGAEAIFGYRAEDILGQPLERLIPERFHAAHTTHVKDFASAPNHTQRMGEYRKVFGRRKDGTEFPVEASIGKARVAGRLFFTVILRDITGRKRAEETLREAERRFRAMLENVQLAAVILDAEGRATFCNEWVLAVTGWARTDVIGQNWFEQFIPLEIRAEMRAIFLNTEAIPLYYENDILTRSGARRLFAWNNTVLRDAEGRLMGLASIGTDITARQQTENALRESEFRYRATVEDQTDLIARWRPDGGLIFVNPAVTHYLGLPAEDLLEQTFADRIVEEDRPAVQALLGGLTRERPVGKIENRVRLPSGEIRWQQWTNRAIFNAEGQLVEYQSVGRDITEEKRAADLVRRQRNELAVRSLILSAILSTADLDELLDLILHEALRHLRVEYGAIHLVRGSEIVLARWRGLSDSLRAELLTFAAERAPEYLREAQIVHEALDADGLIPPAAKRDGIRAWASIPFRLPARHPTGAEEWLGTLIVASRHLEALRGSDVHSLETIASQLALAIDHARAYRQAQERLTRLHTLRTIDQAIMHGLNLREVLHVVLERVPPALGADALAISLLDDQQLATKVFAMRWPNGAIVDEEAFTLADSLLHWFRERQEPVIISDLTQDPRVQMHRHRIRNGRLITYLGVPLVVQARTTGILHILAQQPRVFSDEDLEFFRTLAGQAAIALDNARASAELRQSAARLNEAQRIAQIGSWELDLTTNALVWSAEIYRMFEIDPGAFGASYDAFLNAIHPADRDLVNRTYTDSVRNKTPYDIIHRLQMSDGRIKFVQERCETFYDENGKPLRSVGTVQDVTERKQTEQALYKAEQRYRKLFEQSPDSIVIIDPGTTAFLEFNETAYRQLGYTHEEFSRLSISDIEALETPAETRARTQQLFREGHIVFETEHRTRQGEKRSVSVNANVIELEGEKYIQSIFHDITERKQAEATLHQTQQHLQTIVDNVPVILFALDQNGSFTLSEGKGLVALGLQAGQVVGLSVYDLYRDVPNAVDYIHRALTGERVAFVARLGALAFETHYLPSYNATGQVTGLIGAAFDISAQMQATERIGAQLQEKEILLKEIHHRVKNNLQVISSLLYFQSQKIADPALLELFRETQNRITAMALVHEKLYQSADLAQIDFADYARELAASLFQAYGADPAQIALSIADQRLRLDVNHAIPCGLIVSEAVSNSLKYAFPSGRGGTIRIDLTLAEADAYHLRLGDDGIGLPADIDQRQAASLGLRLIDRLTRQLRGTLERETTAPGTTYHITFPRNQ
jgi:PAS domain S-box-containing protein